MRSIDVFMDILFFKHTIASDFWPYDLWTINSLSLFQFLLMNSPCANQWLSTYKMAGRTPELYLLLFWHTMFSSLINRILRLMLLVKMTILWITQNYKCHIVQVTELVQIHPETYWVKYRPYQIFRMFWLIITIQVCTIWFFHITHVVPVFLPLAAHFYNFSFFVLWFLSLLLFLVLVCCPLTPHTTVGLFIFLLSTHVAMSPCTLTPLNVFFFLGQLIGGQLSTSRVGLGLTILKILNKLYGLL